MWQYLWFLKVYRMDDGLRRLSSPVQIITYSLIVSFNEVLEGYNPSERLAGASLNRLVHCQNCQGCIVHISPVVTNVYSLPMRGVKKKGNALAFFIL